jgi:anti-anti-sigma factor
MAPNFKPTVAGTTATFTLAGRLDAVSAPALADELKKLSGKNIQKVVFLTKDLTYISSAGLRAIVFAKQKMGVDTTVYVVQPQPDVLAVIKMAGFDSFLVIQDSL